VKIVSPSLTSTIAPSIVMFRSANAASNPLCVRLSKSLIVSPPEENDCGWFDAVIKTGISKVEIQPSVLVH